MSQVSYSQLEDKPSAWSKFKGSVRKLGTAPSELWLAFAINFVAFWGFGLLSFSLALYLRVVHGMDDQTAGFAFSLKGVVYFVYLLAFGNLPSRYGVRFTLIVSSVLGMIGYSAVILSGNIYVQLGCVYTFVMVSLATSVPTTKLAVKNYTYESYRSIAYSFFYLANSGAGVLAGVVIDYVLHLFNSSEFAFKVLFSLSVFLYLSALVMSLFLKELDLEDSGQNEVRVTAKTSWCKYNKEVLSLASFWRFATLVVFLIVSKSVYFQLGATLPVYMIRTMGEGAHYGYMLALHELALSVSMPSLTILVYFLNNYSLLVVGGTLVGISSAAMLLGTSYFTIGVFVLVLGVGDGIWTPRLTEYTTQIAPKGKESMFLALAVIPYSLSAMIAGILSGELLSKYCPSNDTSDCSYVWLYVCLIALVSPIVMVAFRRFLEEPKGSFKKT